MTEQAMKEAGRLITKVDHLRANVNVIDNICETLEIEQIGIRNMTVHEWSNETDVQQVLPLKDRRGLLQSEKCPQPSVFLTSNQPELLNLNLYAGKIVLQGSKDENTIGVSGIYSATLHV